MFYAPPQYNIEVHSGWVVFSLIKPTSLNSHKKREEIKRKKNTIFEDEGAATVLVDLTCLSPWIMGSDFRLGLLVFFSGMDHQSRMQLASILEKASLWIGLSEIFCSRSFSAKIWFTFCTSANICFAFRLSSPPSTSPSSSCPGACLLHVNSLSVLILSYTTMFMLLSDYFLGCVVSLKYRQLVSLQWESFGVLIAFYGYLWA